MANFDNTLKTSKPKLILLKQQDNLIKHKPIRELAATIRQTSMKKTLLFGIFVIAQLTISGQTTSGVNLCVQDKKTKQPMSDANIQVVFNDSIRLNLRLDNTGCISKIDKTQGKYKIAVNIDGYLQTSMNGIIIGEGKISYLIYGMTAIKDLTKKEKKYFGIK